MSLVEVPDPRLAQLAEIVQPERTVPAIVEFVDIAGLVAGASKGEGLGNQFLANIREAHAIAQVVRAFDDGDVVHVDGKVDPASDMETINTELIIADMQTVEKAIPRVEKEVKGKKKEPADLEALKAALAVLERGETIFAAKDKDKLDMDRLRELSLLTAKPFIYVFNSDEGVLGDEAKQQELRDLVAPADAVFLDAKLESDLVELSEEEAAEMLEMARSSGKSIARMKHDNERVFRSEAEIRDGLMRIWQVMRDCMDRGLAAEGTLPGGLLPPVCPRGPSGMPSCKPPSTACSTRTTASTGCARSGGNCGAKGSPLPDARSPG